MNMRSSFSVTKINERTLDGGDITWIAQISLDANLDIVQSRELYWREYVVVHSLLEEDSRVSGIGRKSGQQCRSIIGTIGVRDGERVPGKSYLHRGKQKTSLYQRRRHCSSVSKDSKERDEPTSNGRLYRNCPWRLSSLFFARSAALCFVDIGSVLLTAHVPSSCGMVARSKTLLESRSLTVHSDASSDTGRLSITGPLMSYPAIDPRIAEMSANLAPIYIIH